eukprot:scaffold797_cov408-Chaetoceros_neogracile.AAC.50
MKDNSSHVGQKRLQSAITAFHANAQTQTDICVEWKPYIIDPNINPNGEEFEAYNIRRWGSSSWTTKLKQEGRKIDTGANFDNWKWWPNTMKSHRLVRFAKERYGISTNRSIEALFHALYEEGQNLSLNDALVKLGTERLNLPDGDELMAFLESEEGEDEVRADIHSGREMNQMSGVPFFVIGPEDESAAPLGISGAQKKETFLEIFEDFVKSSDDSTQRN